MTSELSSFAARLREFIQSCFPAGDDQFAALALELFRLQFTYNAAYRRLCEAKEVSPENVTRWSQIPAVPTAAFKEVELTCLTPEERAHVFHSSGTTEQQPSRHFHNPESLAVYEVSLWMWFSQHVLADLKSQISDFRLAILTPPPAQAPRSSLVHMFESVRRKLGAPVSSFVGRVGEDGSWRLDFEAMLAALNCSRRREKADLYVGQASPPPHVSGYDKPLVLLGTAFSFVHLLDFLAEHNLRFQLPPGSRVMETGGYKGRSRSLPKAELHALITEWLGVPASHIVCEYGMNELSSQAYDLEIQKPESRIQNPNRAFRFPPWARAQIVSPETGREVADGETGLIRVFDLANVFSVMAVQTEDLGIRRGDGFELIGRAAFAEPRGCSLMAV